MKSPWFYFYNILFVPLLLVMTRLAAPFDKKLREGLRGRGRIFENLERAFKNINNKNPRAWFHVSSLGEFEQAKPIIQTLKIGNPNITIIVTFFSPSGYKNSVNYKYADIISYLPLDSRKLARKFITAVKPNIAVFIRYDVWPNHVWTLAELKIPVFLSSATLNVKSVRLFPVFRSFHRHLYGMFTAILTVTERDAIQFRKLELGKTVVETTGDTRYDQVLQRSRTAEEIELLPRGFTRRKKVLVVGSSWHADEEHLIPALRKLKSHERNLLTILVPHEPTQQNLERIEKNLGDDLSYIRFSYINNYNGEKVIIVDSIGVLVALYKYAHVAYVGGGFKSGVHNVLEAAVYGIPVVYGPNHTRSQEAVELARRKGGFVVTGAKSVYAVLKKLLSDSQQRKKAGLAGKHLVEENGGATDRIISYLSSHVNKV